MAIRISKAKAKELGLVKPRKATASKGTAKTTLMQEMFLLQSKLHGLPTPEFEVKFALSMGRKWAADAIYEHHLIVEVDGGWGMRHGGGHRSITGFLRDMERSNAITLLGYRLLRFTPQQIDSGEAFVTIKEALGPLSEALA